MSWPLFIRSSFFRWQPLLPLRWEFPARGLLVAAIERLPCANAAPASDADTSANLVIEPESAENDAKAATQLALAARPTAACRGINRRGWRRPGLKCKLTEVTRQIARPMGSGQRGLCLSLVYCKEHMNKIVTVSMVSVLLAVSGAAQAQLIGNYYILPNQMAGQSRHIDTLGGIDGSVVTGLVHTALGPNGLPVATAVALTRAGGSGPIRDVNAGNEILWWTPGRTGNKAVLFEQTRLDPANLNFTSSFFTEGATNNNSGFRAVHWNGSFVLGSGQTGSVNMTLRADDDAWVFINGQLAVDNGGVKAINNATTSNGIAGLLEGVNTIDIFFADRHQTQSGIVFTSNVNIVPAPGAAALLGLAGLLTTGRRRTK